MWRRFARFSMNSSLCGTAGDTRMSRIESQAVEMITDGPLTLAIIVSQRYRQDGIRFFTSNELSQQLAYMHHPAEN
jgi:hypothetical protein